MRGSPAAQHLPRSAPSEIVNPNSRTPTASPRLVTGANRRAPLPRRPPRRPGPTAPPVRRPEQWHALGVSCPCSRNMPVPPEWPSRINERPLKSAIRKLTSRAPTASASADASTSIAATGGAASTAAREHSSSTAIAGPCPSLLTYATLRFNDAGNYFSAPSSFTARSGARSPHKATVARREGVLGQCSGMSPEPG
jgi:hypothetical protein